MDGHRPGVGASAWFPLPLPRVFGDHSGAADRGNGGVAVPTINRAGVSIHYESHGADTALPILLSHGYGATARMWDGQVAGFADRCRLILWDMRGHGQSGDPPDPAAYSQALRVADMATVLDDCGVYRAIIGGLSPGGGVSLPLHLAPPQPVPRL